MMMLGALLVWWAARVVPAALGLTTATVNVGGSLRVGGTRFIDCTRQSSTVTVNKPNGNGKTNTGTETVISCTNEMAIPVTVDLSGSLTPPRAVPPTLLWSANPISLTAGNPTDGSDLSVSAIKSTTAGSYTFTFTTAVTGANGLDYSETHTVTVIVQ